MAQQDWFAQNAPTPEAAPAPGRFERLITGRNMSPEELGKAPVPVQLGAAIGRSGVSTVKALAALPELIRTLSSPEGRSAAVEGMKGEFKDKGLLKTAAGMVFSEQDKDTPPLVRAGQAGTDIAQLIFGPKVLKAVRGKIKPPAGVLTAPTPGTMTSASSTFKGAAAEPVLGGLKPTVRAAERPGQVTGTAQHTVLSPTSRTLPDVQAQVGRGVQNDFRGRVSIEKPSPPLTLRAEAPAPTKTQVSLQAMIKKHGPEEAAKRARMTVAEITAMADPTITRGLEKVRAPYEAARKAHTKAPTEGSKKLMTETGKLSALAGKSQGLTTQAGGMTPAGQKTFTDLLKKLGKDPVMLAALAGGGALAATGNEELGAGVGLAGVLPKPLSKNLLDAIKKAKTTKELDALAHQIGSEITGFKPSAGSIANAERLAEEAKDLIPGKPAWRQKLGEKGAVKGGLALPLGGAAAGATVGAATTPSGEDPLGRALTGLGVGGALGLAPTLPKGTISKGAREAGRWGADLSRGMLLAGLAPVKAGLGAGGGLGAELLERAATQNPLRTVKDIGIVAGSLPAGLKRAGRAMAGAEDLPEAGRHLAPIAPGTGLMGVLKNPSRPVVRTMSALDAPFREALERLPGMTKEKALERVLAGNPKSQLGKTILDAFQKHPITKNIVAPVGARTSINLIEQGLLRTPGVNLAPWVRRMDPEAGMGKIMARGALGAGAGAGAYAYGDELKKNPVARNLIQAGMGPLGLPFSLATAAGAKKGAGWLAAADEMGRGLQREFPFRFNPSKPVTVLKERVIPAGVRQLGYNKPTPKSKGLGRKVKGRSVKGAT